MTVNSHLIVCENYRVKIFLHECTLVCQVVLEGFPLEHAFSNTKISQTKVKVGTQQQNPYYVHVTECRLILILSVKLGIPSTTST